MSATLTGLGHLMNIPLDAIHPSPENDKLYQPIDLAHPDAELVALSESIAENGILDPLVITWDSWIVSGHRRYAAARLAGLSTVPCRFEPINRADDLDAFVSLLREHNRQRVKTLAERLREEAASVKPHEAYQALIDQRKRKSGLSDFDTDAVDMGQKKRRKEISKASMPLLNAVIKIIEDLREFWPLSDRGIHYPLLNNPPLKHASKPGSVYTNCKGDYGKLCDLLTRARIAGLIDWNCIADETRPFTDWGAWDEPGLFIREQFGQMFKGYWRNLMQSQPNHIEIYREKLTVKKIIETVAMKYCIPVTIGRGQCSSDPRRKMVERFKRSGKEKLIVLMLTDFDPDGEQIAQSFGRSLRDDFGVEDVKPIKVALTAAQAKAHNLPLSLEAKPTSSNYKKFLAKYGRHAHELEAIDPRTLQKILGEAIDRVIDVGAFNAEVNAEERDADYLEGVRRTVQGMLKELRVEGGAG